MKRIRAGCFTPHIFALAWLAAAPAHAGAWPQAPGESLLIQTLERATADSEFGGEAPVDFAKTETRIYGEHGLAERWTLTGQFVLQDVRFDGTGGRTDYSGPAAARAGLRRALWTDGSQWLSFGADIGYQRGGEYVTDAELIYEDLSSDLRLLYGRGWARGFVDAQGGYVARYGRGPDSWVADATLGWRPLSRLTLAASAFGRSTDAALIGGDEIRASDSLKLKAALVYNLRTDIQVEFGVLSTVAGRNHVRDSGFSLGVWRRFGAKSPESREQVGGWSRGPDGMNSGSP